MLCIEKISGVKEDRGEEEVFLLGICLPILQTSETSRFLALKAGLPVYSGHLVYAVPERVYCNEDMF